MKIELGKTYVDRKGFNVTIKERLENPVYNWLFKGDNNLYYAENGMMSFDGSEEMDEDLVSEYIVQGERHPGIYPVLEEDMVNSPTDPFRGGIKHDQEKVRMDLLEPSFTVGTAKVLTFGAKKYSPYNYRKGIEFSRSVAAIHRHLAAIQSGEYVDEEGGELHVYHIATNCQFLGWMMENKPEFDDIKEPNE